MSKLNELISFLEYLKSLNKSQIGIELVLEKLNKIETVKNP